MSTSSPGPAPLGTDGGPEPSEASAADGWQVVGLVLTGTWAALLAIAVALWARIALFPGPDATDGSLRWLGAPFALFALGLLWWLWRSARHLRRGRREGWTPLLVLGGVAVVQSVITARPLLAPAGPGATDATASPREIAAGLLTAIVLGLVSVVVAVVGRRRSGSRGPHHREVTTGSVSDPR